MSELGMDVHDETKPIPAGYRQCQHAGEILPYYSGFIYKDKFVCGKCCMKALEKNGVK